MNHASWAEVRLPIIQEGFRPAGHKWARLNRATQKAKLFMSSLGFRLNIDYRFELSYNTDELKILLAPESESYASWIVLNWDKEKCGN